MDGLDPARLAKSQPMDLVAEVMPLMITSKVAWTVVGAPTQGWADSIGVADVAALWDAVADRDAARRGRPRVAAWRAHIAKLKERAADPQRPCLRPGPLPGPGHRPHDRPRARLASGSAAR